MSGVTMDEKIDQKESAAPETAAKSVSTFEQRHQKRKKMQLAFVAIAIVLIAAISAGAYYLLKPTVNKNQTRVASTDSLETKKALTPGILANHIVIPSLDINEPLYTSPSGTLVQDDLLKGATFFDPNTNTIGAGNCVVFGHSAVTSEHGAPFGAIGDGLLEVGAEIILSDSSNNKFTYVVSEIIEIASTDFTYVRPINSEEPPVLTIITCKGPDYPKDIRIMVRAGLKK
jgi:LPXTG-site transpeptidase (sortase) family protein